MPRFLVGRLLGALLSLWLASLLVFAALASVPGDPAAVILGMNASPEALAALRERLGSDRPPVQRYLGWLGSALRGDLGDSLQFQRPVTALIGDRLGVSVPLALAAACLAALVSLPLGTLAALQRGRPWDPMIVTVSQLGAAVPAFWLGLLLILVFAVGLGWLPASGFPRGAGVLASARALLLPILALAAGQAATMTRMTRSAMLEVLDQDYVRTARAKGLPAVSVLGKHALRNALVTLLTVFGLSLSNLFIGAIVIEQVFALPGLGNLTLGAVGNRDFPLVQGLILLYAGSIIALGLLVDLAYGWLDPRIRYA